MATAAVKNDDDLEAGTNIADVAAEPWAWNLLSNDLWREIMAKLEPRSLAHVMGSCRQV